MQHRQRVMRVLFLVFAAVVVGLVLRRARDVDWDAVWAALADYGAATLAAAAACALGAHALAGCYDLIGRRIVGHRVAAPRVFLINVVAFSFSLNLGALVGGWGFRARLYSRFGLGARTVMEIIALAVVTNWSGYVLIAGTLLWLYPLPLPPSWTVDPAWLRALGLALLATALMYVLWCALAARRRWLLHVRGIGVRSPGLPLALLQVAWSSLSWLSMAGALYLLLPAPVPFVHVVSVLLICSIAGALLHVPGALGVLEVGVLRLLPGDNELAPTLAAVLAFRALYYFLPFATGAVAYGWLEWTARSRSGHGSPP